MHSDILSLSQEDTKLTAEALTSLLLLPWDPFPSDGTGRGLIKDNWEFLFIAASDRYPSSSSLSPGATPGFGPLHPAKLTSSG